MLLTRSNGQLLEAGIGVFTRSLSHIERGFCSIEGRFGHSALLNQGLLTLKVLFGLLELRICLRQLGTGLVALFFGCAVTELGQAVPCGGLLGFGNRDRLVDIRFEAIHFGPQRWTARLRQGCLCGTNGVLR